MTDPKTILQEAINNDATKKVLHNIKIKGDKCYYYSVDIENNQPLHTQIFNYTDEFKRDFLEPFILYQASNNTTNNIMVQDNKLKEENKDLYFITKNGNFTRIDGLEEEYANQIIEITEQKLTNTNGYSKKLIRQKNETGSINIMTILVLIGLIINIFVMLTLKK